LDVAFSFATLLSSACGLLAACRATCPRSASTCGTDVSFRDVRRTEIGSFGHTVEAGACLGRIGALRGACREQGAQATGPKLMGRSLWEPGRIVAGVAALVGR